MKSYCVKFVRYGYAEITSNTEAGAMTQAQTYGADDIDWGEWYPDEIVDAEEIEE